MRRRTLTTAAWGALLAFLLVTLAPGLAQAAGVGRPADPGICSTDGAPRNPAALHTLEHCPGCFSQALPLALPPAALRGPAVAPGADALPQPPLRVAGPAAPWRYAPARAPPSGA